MGIDYTKRRNEAPQPTGAGAGAGASAGAGAGGVSLTKVTLTKSAPTVSLTKQGSATGMLRVNLNWNSRPGTGMFGRAGGAIDLDLACLFEYTDGSRGVVQALGDTFRDMHSFGPDPICWLDGDDRSGSNTAGENLFVNLLHVNAIRRMLVFAFIYEGAPNWAAANAVVTLFPAVGPQVEVRLDEHDPRSPMCAIALLENVAGELSVRREVRYIQGGHKVLDQTYRWGLRWTAGSK